MFSYFLSIFVAFFCFGVVYNVLCRLGYIIDDDPFNWLIVGMLAIFWAVAIPVAALIFSLYLTKLLTDAIINATFTLLQKIRNKRIENERDD